MLALMQIVGADCILDGRLLSTDPCLRRLFRDIPVDPDLAARFLEWLGQQHFESEKAAGFQAIIAESAKQIWKAWQKTKPKQITIDLVVATLRNAPPHVSWNPSCSEELPFKAFCFWREANLILSGRPCANPGDIVAVISDALDAVPAEKYGRNVRTGLGGFSKEIIECLKRKRITARTKYKNLELPVGFMVGVPMDAAEVESMGIKETEWRDYNNVIFPSLQWCCISGLEERNRFSGLGLSLTILRWNKGLARNMPTYAAFVTNRGRRPVDTVDRFLRGRAEVNRAIEDVALLATSGDIDSQAGATAAGRFCLALLSRNLCACIHTACFEDMPNIPLSRFRALFLSTLGQYVKGRRGFLKVYGAEAYSHFRELQEIFPLKDHPSYRLA
jgi:hypothetical protein